MKILILEDERALAESMAEFLEDVGYEVSIFSHSEDALNAIYEHSFELLLLDVKVHGQSGFEMLKELREQGSKIPAIFVTSLTDIGDLTQGYKSGCCDYIRKPFELAELQLRVENVIKSQYSATDKELIELPEGFSYDITKFKLYQNDNETSLTKTEVKMIELLIKHRGSVVSLELFSDEVWSHGVLEANVRVQINQLRKKTDKNLIRNVRGLGYTIDS